LKVQFCAVKYRFSPNRRISIPINFRMTARCQMKRVINLMQFHSFLYPFSSFTTFHWTEGRFFFKYSLLSI
jgi:hypothetical protein